MSNKTFDCHLPGCLERDGGFALEISADKNKKRIVWFCSEAHREKFMEQNTELKQVLSAHAEITKGGKR